MTRPEALKKLRRLLGDKLGYRVDDRAPSPEEREAARVALPEARAERERLSRDMCDRRNAVLKADAEFQRLYAAEKAARKTLEKLTSQVHRHKFTVGTSSDLFFHVKAEGDSWEEVIAKLSEPT